MDQVEHLKMEGILIPQEKLMAKTIYTCGDINANSQSGLPPISTFITRDRRTLTRTIKMTRSLSRDSVSSATIEDATGE